MDLVVGNVNDSDTINEEVARRRISNTIIITSFTFIGLFGTITNIVLYHKLNDASKIRRFFICILAWSDLFALCHMAVATPLENTYAFVYFNDALCKYWVYNAVLTNQISACLLLIIAYHRYRLVCFTAKVPLGLEVKRLAAILAFVIPIVICLPLLFLSGSGKMEIMLHNQNVSASPCRVYSTTYSLIYFTIMSIFNGTIVSTSAFLFVKVGRVVFYRTKTDVKPSAVRNTNDENSDHPIKLPINPGSMPPLGAVISRSSCEVSRNINNPSTRRKRYAKKRGARTNFAHMFIAVFVLNVVANFPQMTVRTIVLFDESFLFRQEEPSLFFLLFCMRSGVLIHTLNPFIFMFFDMELNRQARNLFCK